MDLRTDPEHARSLLSRRYGGCSGQRHDRCLVPPSPKLREKLRKQLEAVTDKSKGLMSSMFTLRMPNPVGMNDGVIVPGTYYPLGTPPSVVRSARLDRAPMHGTLRVLVVLVDFSDKAMSATKQHFEDLFFSTGVLPSGSVREYFQDVTNGLVTIAGEVVGPYRLPQTLAQYAHGASGIGNALPNARTMARDAALAANPDVDFGAYDNDGDGFVDAYVIVHAGQGAEETGSDDDIWSHKWVLSGGELNADGAKVFAYLTVPEDARIGVCCHELGHLLFGFPDLYDTDGTSEGVGNWCLMGGGSWNGGGDRPAHPNAWCKAQQEWVTVVTQTANANVSIADVKTSRTVYRLWKDGSAGNEYFLVENRQKSGYDQDLPGQGLLIWHIDDAISSNSDESHPRVKLMEADGADHLRSGANRGDAGDAFPGTSNKTAFTAATTPNSKSYAGSDACVAVTNISASGPTMTAKLAVACVIKPGFPENKNYRKDVRDTKRLFKEFKERLSEGKAVPDKRPEKPVIDKAVAYDKGHFEKPGEKLVEGGWEWGTEFAPPAGVPETAPGIAELEARIAALEERLEQPAQPFIPASLRPDLSQGAVAEEPDVKLTKRRVHEEAAYAAAKNGPPNGRKSGRSRSR